MSYLFTLLPIIMRLGLPLAALGAIYLFAYERGASQTRAQSKEFALQVEISTLKRDFEIHSLARSDAENKIIALEQASDADKKIISNYEKELEGEKSKPTKVVTKELKVIYPCTLNSRDIMRLHSIGKASPTNIKQNITAPSNGVNKDNASPAIIQRR